jgi:nucleotide-binding universal stress UspA family protein
LTAAIQHGNEIKPKLFKSNGTVIESVVSLTTIENPDLIIMGTHGASGYRPGFIGSNTYGVLKHSPCPVLTIPPRRKFNSFENALFPIRPVAGALARYDVACHFLAARSTVEVLGLSYLRMERETTVLEKIADEIRDKVTADEVALKTTWSADNSFTDHILQLVQEAHHDLLILTSSLDAISKSNFIGPNTQKIINCSKVPLLVIKHVGVPILA